MDKKGEGGQEVKLPVINRLRECNAQPSECSQQHCVVRLIAAKRVNLKSSHHRKDVLPCKLMDVNLL